jgi:hypothetical protein
MRSEVVERPKDGSCPSELDNVANYLSYAIPDVAAYDVTAYFLLELCINILRERRDCGDINSEKLAPAKH